MRTCPHCQKPISDQQPRPCLGCGRLVEQNAIGRPRKWCDDPTCRKLSRDGGVGEGLAYLRLTPIQRQKIVDDAGECAICHTARREWLVVDHDHLTGEVRGVLCQVCNTGLVAALDIARRSGPLKAVAEAYLDGKTPAERPETALQVGP